jgi:nucleoside-diphosphate-sugar epimerase
MNTEDFNQIINSPLDWSKFQNKTILITGANGFLPAYMVEILLLLNQDILQDSPCKVIALVRNKKRTQERFKNYLNDEKFEIIIQDVADDINLSQKIDYIIHAASPASPKYYNINPVGVIMPNVLGTKNTLELARKNNIKGYLYFSSSEVYGQLYDGDVVTEDKYGYLDPTSVRACYAESKRMGETLCVSYGRQYKVPVKIVRPFHTYGPGMRLDDGRVFADFVKNIVNNEDIEMKSDGSAIRTFCYLSDATTAFFKVLLDGEVNNAYNVANAKAIISIKKLALLLVNMYPEKKLKAVFSEQNTNYLQSPIKGNSVDTSKLEKLDWKPTVSIQDGFKKTIRSY